MIQRGDVLHCDVGITALRLQHRHPAQRLRAARGRDRGPGRPAGRARRTPTGCRTCCFEEIRPGRTGNEVLHAPLGRDAGGRPRRAPCTPIRSAIHGHGAGPLIGLWDYQEGVPGRGDVPVSRQHVVLHRAAGDHAGAGVGRPPVRMAQEEDFQLGVDGRPRWFYQRQAELFLVR